MPLRPSVIPTHVLQYARQQLRLILNNRTQLNIENPLFEKLSAYYAGIELTRFTNVRSVLAELIVLNRATPNILLSELIENVRNTIFEQLIDADQNGINPLMRAAASNDQGDFLGLLNLLYCLDPERCAQLLLRLTPERSWNVLMIVARRNPNYVIPILDLLRTLPFAIETKRQILDQRNRLGNDALRIAEKYNSSHECVLQLRAEFNAHHPEHEVNLNDDSSSSSESDFSILRASALTPQINTLVSRRPVEILNKLTGKALWNTLESGPETVMKCEVHCTELAGVIKPICDLLPFMNIVTIPIVSNPMYMEVTIVITDEPGFNNCPRLFQPDMEECDTSHFEEALERSWRFTGSRSPSPYFTPNRSISNSSFGLYPTQGSSDMMSPASSSGSSHPSPPSPFLDEFAGIERVSSPLLRVPSPYVFSGDPAPESDRIETRSPVPR